MALATFLIKGVATKDYSNIRADITIAIYLCFIFHLYRINSRYHFMGLVVIVNGSNYLIFAVSERNILVFVVLLKFKLLVNILLNINVILIIF